MYVIGVTGNCHQSVRPLFLLPSLLRARERKYPRFIISEYLKGYCLELHLAGHATPYLTCRVLPRLEHARRDGFLAVAHPGHTSSDIAFAHAVRDE